MKINSENLNINLRHLRAVHAILAEGSFARAAAHLGVVPSALTETVRQLEESLGAKLFDRSLRPPQPTPLGLELLRETAPLLAGMDQSLARLRNHATMGEGVLTVGAAPSAISTLVGPALARFRAKYPAIRCHLYDDVAEGLAQRVLDGTLDLAIAGRVHATPDLHQTLLARDRFGLACAVTHKLASEPFVRLGQIDPNEVISLDAGTGSQQQLLETPEVPAALCSGPIQAHSTVAQLCMIRAGLGVGLLPENAVGLFGDPTIRFVPLADLDLWRAIYLLRPNKRARSHIAAAFVTQLGVTE